MGRRTDSRPLRSWLREAVVQPALDGADGGVALLAKYIHNVLSAHQGNRVPVFVHLFLNLPVEVGRCNENPEIPVPKSRDQP